MTAMCMLNLGRAARHVGEAERAIALLGEALRAFVRLDNAWGVAVCLDGFACVAADRGDFLGAARLYGAERGGQGARRRGAVADHPIRARRRGSGGVSRARRGSVGGRARARARR